MGKGWLQVKRPPTSAELYRQRQNQHAWRYGGWLRTASRKALLDRIDAAAGRQTRLGMALSPERSTATAKLGKVPRHDTRSALCAVRFGAVLSLPRLALIHRRPAA
jgi:hypothetical protein